MAKLLIMDFPYTGPFGNQMAEQLSDLRIKLFDVNEALSKITHSPIG